MEKQTNSERLYSTLYRKYILVYVLATFADWLQGAYLYKLYLTYNYDLHDISLLYTTGFFSSMVFGIAVGHLADKFGRRTLCISYTAFYIFSCLSKVSKDFPVLLLGRIFAGVSTSILVTTFESWYVGQHLFKYHLDERLINETFTNSTFYNGLSAIFAGLISSVFAETLDFGPLAPFLLAIPILLTCGYFCFHFWDESCTTNDNSMHFNLTKSLDLIFLKNNKILLYLGSIQSLFESVIYVFVFLWTPILSPIQPNYGFIFSLFMVSIMIGSYSYSFLYKRFQVSCERLLQASLLLSTSSVLISSLGAYLQIFKSYELLGTYICLISFFIYEISIGIYYPAIGYLKSIILPESYRTTITNWFRVPTNLFTCFILMFIRFKIPQYYLIFYLSFSLLLIAQYFFIRFLTIYKKHKTFRIHSRFDI